MFFSEVWGPKKVLTARITILITLRKRIIHCQRMGKYKDQYKDVASVTVLFYFLKRHSMAINILIHTRDLCILKE